jgi:hypothetical protein
VCWRRRPRQPIRARRADTAGTASVRGPWVCVGVGESDARRPSAIAGFDAQPTAAGAEPGVRSAPASLPPNTFACSALRSPGGCARCADVSSPVASHSLERLLEASVSTTVPTRVAPRRRQRRRANWRSRSNRVFFHHAAARISTSTRNALTSPFTRHTFTPARFARLQFLFREHSSRCGAFAAGSDCGTLYHYIRYLAAGHHSGYVISARTALYLLLTKAAEHARWIACGRNSIT